MSGSKNRRLKRCPEPAEGEEDGSRLHRFKVLCGWFSEYLTISNYRPRTITDYAKELSLFRRHIEEQADIADIDDITPDTLRDFTASLYERQLSSGSIHHKLAVLQSFFGALYEKNKLYIDLRPHITFPRLPRRLPKDILSEEEIGRVFGWLEANAPKVKEPDYTQARLIRDRALFELLYSTGLRRAEVRSLRLDDVNYAEGLVHVREGKGGRERMTPIGEKSLRVIGDYVHHARPLLAGRDNPHLFVGRRRGPMGGQTMLDRVGRIARDAGITRHVNVHSIRHSSATHMLNHGADIRYVQEFLGHKSLASTQVYTHVSIGKLKETHARFHPREQDGFLVDEEQPGHGR